ncbi:MAG: alginate export family protein [Verrucomicrobiae bacterium]|nr:alginate export family protein [Verrucomicrobiae bacterium]
MTTNLHRLLSHFLEARFHACCLTIALLTCQSLTAQQAGDFGRFTGDFRARFESANQEDRDSSEALTFRSRVGFETKDMEGFQFFIEGSDVRALDADDYLGYPGPGATVIADPEGTDLNRATIRFARESFTGILGRQRIKLDGDRFIGNVGWRQREQTYDAVTLKYQEGALTGFYGYIDKVKRIFGPEAPTRSLRTFDSQSHLFNGSYKLSEAFTLGGYAYLLDISNAETNSCNTAGLSLQGSIPIEDTTKLSIYLETARQEGANGNPSHYRADYHHAVLGLNVSGVNVSGGLELLGSDKGVGFKTPLATLHKFNGWADAFLNTPADGLQDFYFSLGTTVEKVALTAAYHDFSSRVGGHYLGGELDLQASWKLMERVTCIAKAADLQGRNGIPDSRKFWLEGNYSF